MDALKTVALIYCIVAIVVVLIASVPLTFMAIDEVKGFMKKWKKGE